MNLKLSLPKSKNPLLNLIVTYIAIAIVAALVLGFLVIKPLMHSANTTSAQLSLVNKQIAALKQLDKDTQTLRRNYQAVEDQSQQILNLLPAQTEEERLLALVDSFASASGVVMSTFSPTVAAPSSATGSTTASGYTTYTVTTSLTGNFAALQNFYKHLETGARYIDVTTTNMSSGSAGSSLTASVTFQAYYQTNSSVAATSGATP